ncbi:hypothetical protein LUZ60_002843 [Juncus effusus]|nr:hypothetical protein LUZ60_002843 [Juncus effusus]
MASNSAEVITTNCCTKLFLDSNQPSNSRLGFTKMLMSSADVSMPFSGLVICVTGLSKEARSQVMEATERLGGEYSGSLHPKCTHLVVQISFIYIYNIIIFLFCIFSLIFLIIMGTYFGGRKYDHAIKHGVKNGLHVVTLSWFVDSAKNNVRLNESLYGVKYNDHKESQLVELNQLLVPTSEISCLPLINPNVDLKKSSKRESENNQPIFHNQSIYVDTDISSETKKKIVESAKKDGAKLLDHWFISSNANYVICEGPSIHKYIVHSNNLVTPLWMLKTIKEKSFQRLVHLSSDLAKHISVTLENSRVSDEVDTENRAGCTFPLSLKNFSVTNEKTKGSLEERKKIAELAKQGVRDRRKRRMHPVSLSPITPTSLLDSICWSVSDQTTSACIYTDSALSEQWTPPVCAGNGEGNDSGLLADDSSLSRPLKESEKREVVFKNHFITILFPIDRFGEMGPTSRTFFSSEGFTCIQLLDHIYNFYQENMSSDEMEIAIHTDSRHADRLRALYASDESIKQGFVSFKRIDFMGSRRSFESLKRLSGNANCNVYELLVRA